MKHAIISDVHANLEALEVVLDDIKKRGIDDIIFLGDAVGYGPDPVDSLRLIKAHSSLMIRGNHDQTLIEPLLLDYFNEYARMAIEWTVSMVDNETINIIRDMPLIAEKNLNGMDVVFVHGSPKEPEKWHYIMTLDDVEINLHYFDGNVCFVGHSHQPFLVEQRSDGEMVIHRKTRVNLNTTSRYIINAGSVGQPRDMDPKACYVILDDGEISFVRLSYDILRTQKKMKEAGLPRYLIERLARGV